VPLARTTVSLGLRSKSMESPLALVCLILSIVVMFIYGALLWYIAMTFPFIAFLIGGLVGLVVLLQGAEWYRIYYRTD
jgi:hypothetical protein